MRGRAWIEEAKVQLDPEKDGQEDFCVKISVSRPTDRQSNSTVLHAAARQRPDWILIRAAAENKVHALR
jgi:hypothetical protein